MSTQPILETVTLSQAKALIKCLAHDQSLLLLSPPGVGKSDTVAEAAREMNLPCRSLLGTQIAPEDVSGIPRLVGERSVFCPPRMVLPEEAQPFCLFLDELPACAPDIQKAFYSLLLERRLGEHKLPTGTWVVAAGNRLEDRALVRSLSSALINRVIILHIRVDVEEWCTWARGHNVRAEVVEFLHKNRDSLLRPVPSHPEPFSTPRAWASLAQALDLAEKGGVLNDSILKALAHGRVSPADARAFVRFVQLRRGDQPDAVTRDAVLSMTLADLELSVRATNCLETEGITTVADLIRCTEDQLLDVRNFGQTTLAEVKKKLEELGLWLGMDLG
jgi:hypothetical protein